MMKSLTKKEKQSGVIYVAFGILLPILLTLFLGMYDVFRMLQSRQVVSTAFLELMTDYKNNPLSIDLSKFREKAGVRWVDFNSGKNSCIVVTAHSSAEEAQNALNKADCATESLKRLSRAKPYFALLIKHQHRSLFSSLIYGTDSNFRSINHKQVVHSKVMECDNGQAIVSDGEGWIECSDDIERLKQELSRIEERIDKIGEEIKKVEETIQSNYNDLLKRLGRLNQDIDALRRTLQEYIAELSAKIDYFNSLIRALTADIDNINRVLNSHRATLNSHQAQINSIRGSIANLQRQIDSLRNLSTIPYLYHKSGFMVGWHGPPDISGKGGYISHGNFVDYTLAPFSSFKRCELLAKGNSQDGKKGNDHAACNCDVWVRNGQWTLSVKWKDCKGYCRVACELPFR